MLFKWERLMPYVWKIVFFVCLVAPAFSSNARAESNLTCKKFAINNCPCAMPIMESRLNSEEINLLIRTWINIKTKDANRQARFFSEQSAKLLPVSLRYGEIKYFIAFKCGALAFDDE